VESADIVPDELKLICNTIYHSIFKKIPDVEFIEKCIGNIIFLRFICPAIMIPEHYDLIQGKLENNVNRSLILSCKILQKMANGNFFDLIKEEEMIYFNNFIQENEATYKEFIKRIYSDKKINLEERD